MEGRTRPLMMPLDRERRPAVGEDVGLEVSDMPSGPFGMESRPPILKPQSLGLRAEHFQSVV